MGLTWSEADKDRKEHNFSLATCKITLTFVFDHNGDNRFTRIIDDKKPPALVADFGTLTLPSPVLQSFELSMGFTLIEFQLITGPTSPQVRKLL